MGKTCFLDDTFSVLKQILLKKRKISDKEISLNKIQTARQPTFCLQTDLHIL